MESWKAKTIYMNYKEDDKTIIFFWDMLKDFDAQNKKAFMKFLTGSEKVPIGGLSVVKLIITRTADIYKLPSVSTCSNNLFLPDYQQEEFMR